MQKSNIPAIIQDFVKRINSTISLSHIFSLLVTFIVLLGFFVYIHQKKDSLASLLTYTEGEESVNKDTGDLSQLFASKNGKTYTYSWCSGASRILDKNKIYFATEEDAKRTGRTLSKNCK